MMRPYRDVNGDSGVEAYDYDEDSIRVRFKTGATYEYTYASAGRAHIEAMKRLADAGNGLNAFINQFVRLRYARKIG
ncbi:MAG: hypothetical protein ACM3XN_01275 [Chloroflexota bacterium]